MNQPEIVVVGSLNNDVVTFLSRFPGPGETVTGRDLKTFCGGKGANQAYAAGKLGARAAMVGQVGNDSAGDAQIANLKSVGVNTFNIWRDDAAPTGTAVIGVDDCRENRIIVVPGANGTFTPAQLEQCGELLANARFVLLQLEIPMPTVEAAARLAKTGRAKVILDPAPAAPLSDALLQNVDYVTPNLSELSALSGEPLAIQAPEESILKAARSLTKRGVAHVIAKLGESGALLVTEKETFRWQAFPVTPVDTTAAGDCFNAAFATALASGADHRAAGRFACAAAAISVTRAGAQPSMPSRHEVEEMLAHQTPPPFQRT